MWRGLGDPQRFDPEPGRAPEPAAEGSAAGWRSPADGRGVADGLPGTPPAALARPRSVAVLIQSLEMGGAQIAMLQLAIRLRANGYRVAVVVQADRYPAELTVPEDMDFFSLSRPRVSATVLPLLRFARAWRPDVIVSALPHNNLIAIVASVLSGYRFGVIATEHAPLDRLIDHYGGWRFRVLPALLRRLYPLADAVVGVSNGIADELRGLAPGVARIRAIHNPLVDETIELLAAEPLVPMWAQDDGVPMVLGVGRLAPEKDYATLIRGFARLRARMPARLVIVGDGVERPRLEELARSLGVGQDVILPGAVTNPYALMRRAQVLAVTSLFEGFGNVLVEALACGTQVVATDCPVGPREILGAPLRAGLVPVGDEEALAAALEQAIRAPVDRAVLRARANLFSAAASVRAYEEVIGQTPADAASRLADLPRRLLAALTPRGAAAVACRPAWSSSTISHPAGGAMTASDAPSLDIAMASSSTLDFPSETASASPRDSSGPRVGGGALGGAAPTDAGRAKMSVMIYMSDLSGGGVERLTLSLMTDFRRLGMSVTLFVHAKRGEMLPLLPPDLRVISFDTSRTAADILPLARVLREDRPDVLMSSLNHNNIIALIAKAVSFSATQVIICQHNALSSEATEMGSWKYRVVPMFYRLLSPFAAGMVAVSRGVADDMARVARIARGKITVIYNPVVGDDFENRLNQQAPDPWLDEPGPPVFVNAARLVPQKDQATLLRAFAIVAARMPARLLILGNGPLQGELEDLAAELGIADRVRFAGFIGNPLPYFKRAAAVVLSSRYEGLGNVLIEAMACGTPVITTDCPYGPGEIVDGGRFGRLVPVRDPQALADAFDPGLRRLWPSEVLRERASHFTVRSAASQYRQLMMRVLARRSGEATSGA
jgi:glycosyltransferase involved in cell wall biosynthesis